MNTFGIMQATISHNLKDPHSKALKPNCLSPRIVIMRQSLSGGGREGEKKKSGFTLLEILIGILLLSIALLAIAGMHMASIRGNSFGANMTQVSFVGQSGLEALRGLPFKPNGDWPDALSIGTHKFGAAVDDSGSIPGTGFTRAYTVTQHPNTVNMRIIQMTITWTDKADHTLSFSMIRANQ